MRLLVICSMKIMGRKKKKVSDLQVKHSYPPEALVFSPGFKIENYRRAEKQREIDRDARKKANAENLKDIFQLIDDENICSFAVFMRLVNRKYPNYCTIAVQNHAIIRDFIRDKRYDVSCGFADLDYKQVCNLLKASKQANLDLEESIKQLREEYRCLLDQKNKWYEEYLKKCTSLDESMKLINGLLDTNRKLNYMLGFEELPMVNLPINGGNNKKGENEK